jgi:phosphate transport system permease protein
MTVTTEDNRQAREDSAYAKSRALRKYTADVSAIGEPSLWAFGGMLALGVMLIVGFLALIVYNGISTFWPKPIEIVTTKDGNRTAGEPFRYDSFRVGAERLAALPPETQAEIEANFGIANRTLYRIGNYDLYNADFRWVADFEVDSVEIPQDFYYVERQEWGPFVGRIASLTIEDQVIDLGSLNYAQLQAFQDEARNRFREIRRLEKSEIGTVNYYIERERLNIRRAELRFGPEAPETQQVRAEANARIAEFEQQYQEIANRVRDIRAEDQRTRITLEEVGGRTKEIRLSEVVRIYPSNTVTLAEQIGIYISRWSEFLTSEPREANTEGGVLPAIFGTVTMTLIMVIFVAPFGVITALYLREYAKQGRIVSAVRIAVNNLAGVPSIVYGVFGLGFFAYTFGASIDQLFYQERLPSPTFGTGGLLWSSLTLALLTVPVVIVASEEALSAVPRSMREGSLACGASKWQTIRNIVLPKAMPGIMTGMILAMARGAGEVAPLMLVGVVKLAPELPIDGFAPFIHLERSFMHLGFHIYDVGFQSRNSEAGKPMVFVTTLLLIGLIVVMTSLAIYVRNNLKRKYASSQF